MKILGDIVCDGIEEKMQGEMKLRRTGPFITSFQVIKMLPAILVENSKVSDIAKGLLIKSIYQDLPLQSGKTYSVLYLRNHPC